MKESKTSAILLLIVTLIFVGSISSCKTGDMKVLTQKPDAPKPPSGYLPAQAQQVTFVGVNSDASLSPDGNKILYISKARSAHQHSQVYEMTLSTGTERRVTYHDGENRNPSYHPDGRQFVYSSTTDEVKENPLFLSNSLTQMRDEQITKGDAQRDVSSAHILSGSDLLPFEIYSSYLDGSHIRRLTNQANFDAEASFHPNGKSLVFSSVRKGELNIYQMTSKGKSVLQLTKGKSFNDEARFSKDGKSLAWVKYQGNSSSSQIYIGSNTGKNAKPLLSRRAQFWYPRWHPDGDHILFSSDLSSEKSFELYIAKLDGSCLQRLTYNHSSETHPVFTPNGKEIYFTSDRSGLKQIYKMAFMPPTSCPESQK